MNWDEECKKIDMEEEIMILRRLLWLNHGHKWPYGDDGEMQCGECAITFGFFDWKRTPVKEIEKRISKYNLRVMCLSEE